MILFWFRRDLRLEDNRALFEALTTHRQVQPLFIFDTEILDDLEDTHDRRVDFIHQVLLQIHQQLQQYGSSLWVYHGTPLKVFAQLIRYHSVEAVYCNADYEPYALQRERAVSDLLGTHSIPLMTYKDQVVFDGNEILKPDGTPYNIYTPYSKRWKQKLEETGVKTYKSEEYPDNYQKETRGPAFPALEKLGFKASGVRYEPPQPDREVIAHYHKTRNYPGIQGTSRMSHHLRFGTISIRTLVKMGLKLNETYLNELIWREFYQMILYHFPHTVSQAFKPAYDAIEWVNDETQYDRWKAGQTGYPIVDAGMRELAETGYMHNRLRMITASFLIKHLLIDWRWGEAWFAKKLLDFDLASNVGGWQWVAGSGNDGAPYFRLFNPYSQTQKFDPERKYILKWVPEVDAPEYPKPMVEHAYARDRVLKTYKEALKKDRKI